MPLVPLKIFRQRSLTGENLVAALATAAVTLPHGLAAVLAAPLAARLITRVGVKRTLLIGLGERMVRLLLLAKILAQGNFVSNLLPGTVIVGLGFVTSLVKAIQCIKNNMYICKIRIISAIE